MQELKITDSPNKVVNNADRHVHLCEQTPGTQKYADNIKPALNELEIKTKLAKDARKAVTFASDLIVLGDTELDTFLKETFNRATEYDRKNPGMNVTKIIFPNGLLTPIVSLPNDKEPDEAEKLAQRIVSLGEGHPLFPLATEVQNHVAKCRAAIKGHEDMVKNYGKARTEMELAKIGIIRLYNGNYHKIAGDTNKTFANKLFPKFYRSKKKADEEELEDEEGKQEI